jgi:hypothetical protein
MGLEDPIEFHVIFSVLVQFVLLSLYFFCWGEENVNLTSPYFMFHLCLFYDPLLLTVRLNCLRDNGVIFFEGSY